MNNEDITKLAEITIDETRESIDSLRWAAMVIDAASEDLDEDWLWAKSLVTNDLRWGPSPRNYLIVNDLRLKLFYFFSCFLFWSVV